MYLQDFQRLGGIFVPGKVIKSTTKTVSMQGELHLQGEVFYIKIRHRRNGFVRITQVCGRTISEALNGKSRLKEIWAQAIQDNRAGLRDFVNTRKKRTFVWGVIVIAYLLCGCIALRNLLLVGPTAPALIVILASIVLTSICFSCKGLMLKDRLVIKEE